MFRGVLVLGELGLVLHSHSAVAVGESGVETALRAPWNYVLDGGQLYSTFTVPEKWAFESLVPQPEPSPTFHAAEEGQWLWGGNSWSKATLTLSWVGWGLVCQD